MNSQGKLPTTIDKLLDYPVAAESMSDKELTEFLRPFFPATRPGKLLAASADAVSRMSATMSDEELLALARKRKAERQAQTPQ